LRGFSAESGYLGEVTRRFASRARLRACLCVLAIAPLGCDWVKREVLDLPPPIPARHPQHDLAIVEGKVYYNDQFVGPGLGLAAMEKILGKPTRPGGWYDLGVTALLGNEPGSETEVVAVYVYLTLERDPEGRAIHPFPGRALLDGAALYDAVSINHVNVQMKSNCRSGHGAGLRENALPGYYQCELPAPGPSYWAKVKYGDRKVGIVKIGIEARSKGRLPAPVSSGT